MSTRTADAIKRIQPSQHSRREFLLRLASIVVLVTGLSYVARHAFIDDALIYARYAANALDGNGLVFNAGEHINALTSPVYSYLVLAVAKLLGGHVLVATAIVSGVSLLFACAFAEALVPFAGLVIAATGYFYSLVGMESSLFLCLLLLPILLLQGERESWLPTACIFLLLTRFEGAALLLPLAWELHRRKRWPTAIAYLPAAAIVLAYLALNHHWYGSFFPASASAKFGQGRSGYWGRWPFAFFATAYQLKPDFHSTLYVVIAVLLLLIPGLIRLRRSALPRLSLPFLGILLGFYVLFNIPGYRWYYAPFICFAMMYAAAALPASGRVRWLVMPVVFFSALSAARGFYDTISPPASGATKDYPGIARWLLLNAPANARIEAGEIGTLGWYCQRCYVLDILGLTYPKNADHIAHADSRSWLKEDRPDYIVVHYQPWVFEDVAKQDPAYVRVPEDFGKVVYLLKRRR